MRRELTLALLTMASRPPACLSQLTHVQISLILQNSALTSPCLHKSTFLRPKAYPTNPTDDQILQVAGRNALHARPHSWLRLYVCVCVCDALMMVSFKNPCVKTCPCRVRRDTTTITTTTTIAAAIAAITTTGQPLNSSRHRRRHKAIPGICGAGKMFLSLILCMCSWRRDLLCPPPANTSFMRYGRRATREQLSPLLTKALHPLKLTGRRSH